MAVGQVQGGRPVQQVAQHFQVHKKTIQRLMVKFGQINDVKDMPHSGRHRVTSRREDNFIRTTVLRNHLRTAKEA